jgi:hypothetical protein
MAIRSGGRSNMATGLRRDREADDHLCQTAPALFRACRQPV